MVFIDMGVGARQFPMNTDRAMPRILSFCLALHWTVLFGLLAARMAGAFVDNSFEPLHSGPGALLSQAASLALQGHFAAVMALGSGLAAILFLWMAVTLLFDRRGLTGDADDVARLAFATATGLLTLTLVAGTALPPSRLLSTVSLLLSALLVSFIAVRAEARAVAERMPGADAGEANPNIMALSAAHNSLLSRLSGREGAEGRF